MSEPLRVCVLATGGTIASVQDSSSGGLRPSLSIEDLVSTLPKGMSNISVEQRECFQIDSSNMQPYHWQKMASEIQEIDKEMPDLQGIVVTHGTDTMVYSASAISLMVQDFGKPIVFTGSQIPVSIPWSDGPRNLLDAIRVAAFSNLGEVCMVFNGEIHRPTRTKKVRVNTYDAFDSMDPRPLGFLAREIVLFDGIRKRHNLVPKFDTKIDDRVFLLKIFPGMPPRIISSIIEMGIRGIVIEGYGSGNIPTQENSLTGTIKQAIQQDCTVVISSQCTFGQTDLSLYEVGRAALKAGAISAHDMTSEAAMVKLAWVLGHTTDKTKIEEMMLNDYVGEISYHIGSG